MDEELIIKRKLIFDGEGMGDDRRLNLLQKLIARWVLKTNNCEENQIIFNKICSLLSAVEHSRRRSELVKNTYQKETNRYHQYRQELEVNIKDINIALVTSKVLLLEAKNSKHQKLTYDMIAQYITGEPSRTETSQRVKELENKLLTTKTSEATLNNEWSIWRKHCSVIITTANELISIMDRTSQFD